MLTRGMVVTRCSRGESREKMTKRISHCVFIVQIMTEVLRTTQEESGVENLDRQHLPPPLFPPTGIAPHDGQRKIAHTKPSKQTEWKSN